MQRRPATRQLERASDVLMQSRSARQASTTRVASVQPVRRAKTLTSSRSSSSDSQVPLDFARRFSSARNPISTAEQSSRARPRKRVKPVTKRPSAVNCPSTTWERVRQRKEPSLWMRVPRGAFLLSAVGVSARSHGAATIDLAASERPSSTTTKRTTQAESQGEATSPV